MSDDLIEELEQLVSKLIDGRLSADEASRLDTILSQSPEALQHYQQWLDNHEALCAIYPGDVYEASIESERYLDQGGESIALPPASDAWESATPSRLITLRPWQWVLAVSVLLAVGSAGFYFGKGNRDAVSSLTTADPRQDEQTISGHATLRRSVDLKWTGAGSRYHEGDVLADGLLQFDDGVAEIDFFCGATLIVEGPAVLDIESDWSVRVIEGRMRANVPPAARGFIVKAAESEIVDLGTEFALEVDANNARVEVIDGEVELRGGEHHGDHLTTGQRQWLKGNALPDAFEGLTTLADVQRRRLGASAARFSQWKNDSMQLRRDDRLIAYYPIAATQAGRLVTNAAASGSSRDGTLVGPVQRTAGRFGPDSAGLNFDRPGARVRTRIDGEFDAFTFACWVRIDSLEHVYNALFMSDGYETGELHWQIRRDGCLMFSVMVDDTQKSRHFSKIEQRIVETNGLARVYYTEPIWDISKSGRWFHLAAVYDPTARQVTQFVNGQPISQDEILDKFHIKKLKIGPAEIGNWGQPFRETPGFAVRNLNGTVDEMAIFGAALTAQEIESLFDRGKPLGY